MNHPRWAELWGASLALIGLSLLILVPPNDILDWITGYGLMLAGALTIGGLFTDWRVVMWGLRIALALLAGRAAYYSWDAFQHIADHDGALLTAIGRPLLYAGLMLQAAHYWWGNRSRV